MTPATLKLIRQTHLYFGMFISPAVLFFAFSGALQTFSLHEQTRGSSYVPPDWAVQLGSVHKHQGLMPPPAPEAPKPAAPPASGMSTPAPKPNVATKAPPAKRHTGMKWFFLLVSIGLFTSTFTGITMAYKYKTNKKLVTAALIAGIIVPLVLLKF